MESPFFRNFRGVKPVEPVQRKSKVVSIPVHFVGSETTRSASALKIQKVFRGFRIRRSVKKINSIRREVEEIERRVSDKGTVELIWRESKERLRLNETLMALLFKLDSVSGVDSGVRDLRKGVIRKAIALQERIDDIAAGNQALDSEDLDERQTLETEGNSANGMPSLGVEEPVSEEADDDVNNRDGLEKAGDEGGELHCPNEVEGFSETIDDEKMDIDVVNAGHGSEIKESAEEFVGSDSFANRTPSPEEPEDTEESDVVNSRDSLGEMVNEICETKDDGKMDVAGVGVSSEAKEDEEGCIVKEIVEDQLPTTSEFVEEREETDSHVSNGIGDEDLSERRLRDGVKVEGDDRKRDNTELLERMMEENEKMMSLMTQLYEKNEVQTRMLSSLTHRVEQLERALVCERLRKKKKKRHAGGTVDCLESNPEQKKCGKRL